MALRLAHQTAFLGVGLWHRADDAHAAGWRLSPRRKHGQSLACFQREHRNDPPVSARAQSLRNFAYGIAFYFRVSLWADAFRIGPDIDCPHIPSSSGGGGF